MSGDTREQPTVELDDFEYEPWHGIPIPRWLGDWLEELGEVPVRARATLLWFGFFGGVIVACGGMLVGLYVAYFG